MSDFEVLMTTGTLQVGDSAERIRDVCRLAAGGGLKVLCPAQVLLALAERVLELEASLRPFSDEF